MKPATLLAFPVIALAAAAPKVEERQLGTLPPLPLDLECLAGVANIAQCITLPPAAGTLLSDLTGCALRLPLVIVGALGCVL